MKKIWELWGGVRQEDKGMCIRKCDDIKVSNMKRMDIVISRRRAILEKNVDFEVKMEMFSSALR